mgnify:FL=1|tara:strand:+ start:386 stop:679 length:294 start_codon:yes stop_codon:yes gene_type:complete
MTPGQLEQLRSEMHLVHGTTLTDVMACGHASKQKQNARRNERKRNDRIFDLFMGREYDSSEQACASIVAVVLPFLLRWFLRKAVERVVIWLWNRTHG